MAAPTISQRIALEGADSIIAQLQTMGQAGQRAIEQLSQAAQSSQSPLAGLSDRMNAAGKAVSDAGQKFSQLFADLRNNLPNIQQFAAIFGVTLAGGITGAAAALVDFASRAASSAAEVGRTAQQIGFGVEAYQAWKFAAAAAGLESDKFGVAMGRMARAVEEADKAQTKAAVSLADSLVKGLGQGGVVLQKVGDGFITMAGALGVTLDAAKGIGPKILQPVKLTAEQMDQLRLAASQVADVLAKGGLQVTTDQLARKLLEMGSASEAARQQLRELGVDFPARTVEEAVRRVGDTSIDKFSKMGVAIKEVRDGGLQLRPMEDILADVADKFQKMPDGAQKTALAIELFGRSGRLLVPLLNEGKDGVQHLMEEFARLGVTLTGVQTKAGIEQVRAWHEFETAVAGARNQMGILFTGTVTEGLKAFTDLIRNNIPTLKAWAAEMAGSVNQAVRDFITLIGGQQGPLQNDWLRTVFNGAQELATLFTSTLPEAFAAVKRAADAVADALNQMFGTQISGGAILAVTAIGLMTGALQTLAGIIAPLAVAFALLLGPGGAIVLGFLAATAGLYLFLQQFSDGIAQRQAEWDERWRAMGAFVSDIWTQIVGAVQNALGSMLDAVSSWVSSVIEKISSIAAAIAQAFSSAAASNLPAGGGGESPSPFARGGEVRGPGSPTSDSILAWLSNREFVHNARSVAYYGVAFHRALNAMRIPREALFSALRGLRGFNLGGLIEVPRLVAAGLRRRWPRARRARQLARPDAGDRWQDLWRAFRQRRRRGSARTVRHRATGALDRPRADLEALMPAETLLEISGIGIAPYSARGLTQTLAPIGAASVQRRTINGALDDLSREQFQKYASKISCTDQTTPAIDGIWPGMELTVDCVVELVAPTGSPLSRTPVPGSQRTIGAFTAYRPRLTMRVTNYNLSLDEYAAAVQWELELEEL